MAYGNMFGGSQSAPAPSTNLWVGNNYSSGYSQMSRNNLPNNMNQLSSSYQMNQPVDNIIQVMGPESAQAYQIGPNSRVILMDSDRAVFYIKRTDNSGYYETRAFQFQEIPLFPSTQQVEIPQNIQTPQDIPHMDYVTKSEFDDFKKMIEELVMKSE